MRKLVQTSLFNEEEMDALVNIVDENCLTDGECEKVKLDNSNVIRNISTDQKEILYNIMKLYNEEKPFDCDMTASSLKFYERKKSDKFYIPEPKILFDVYPQQDKIKKIDPLKKLPLEDESIHSIVIDLPFVISPHDCKSMVEKKEGSSLIANRFSSWYPYTEAYENMYWWIKECARVIDQNGIVVYKMQNTVSGAVEHSFEEFSFLCAQKFGLYVIDEFVLQAKARLISDSKIKKQMHARKYTSKFMVFQKNDRLAEKSNCLKMLDMCEKKFAEN